MRNVFLNFRKQRVKFIILAGILIVIIFGGFVWQAQEQNKTPTFLLAWGSQGSGPGQFKDAWSIAVDPSGNVYVADNQNNRIEKFDSSGRFLAQWGSFVSRPGQFNGTRGIAVDSSGNIYVVDSGNNRVEKFGSVPIIPMEQAVLIIAIAVILGSVGAYLTMRKRGRKS